ncbi:hypothetical protein ACOSQ4_016277 [Xanthoceras sorbifolium]
MSGTGGSRTHQSSLAFNHFICTKKLKNLIFSPSASLFIILRSSHAATQNTAPLTHRLRTPRRRTPFPGFRLSTAPQLLHRRTAKKNSFFVLHRRAPRTSPPVAPSTSTFSQLLHRRTALRLFTGSCSSPLLTPQHLHRPSHASASSSQKSEQQRRTAKLLHRSFFNTPRFIGLLRVL